MYAIVEIGGQQFKVEKGQHIFAHRLDQKEGSKVDFDKVLLLDNSGKVNIGVPIIRGAKVTAKVIEHLKGDKVIVFKKKRRKGYKVKNGHRQYLTKLEVLTIEENTSKKEAASKAPAEKVISSKKSSAAKKPAAKKPAAKKPAAKKPAAKKPAAKKPTAKKPTAKKPTAKKANIKK